MEKDALHYIANLKDREKVTHLVQDVPYRVQADGTLGAPVLPLAPTPLALETLSGFVDAYKAGIEDLPEKVAIHVENYKTVSLISLRSDVYGRRRCYARAVCAESNPFNFGEYQSPENFLIGLQASFLPTETVLKLQRLCSSLSAENAVTTADDGFSQVVTVKAGTVTRDAVKLPPRIPLVPYRTFRDAVPVESEFLLRLKGAPSTLPSVALFEIDGGKWKLDTVLSIARGLGKSLPEATIIA